jgi:hypothetical protein
MTKVTFDISMSLDGFIRAADPTPEQPLGVGGEQLHTLGPSARMSATALFWPRAVKVRVPSSPVVARTTIPSRSGAPMDPPGRRVCRSSW